jgi:hypothetical protein
VTRFLWLPFLVLILVLSGASPEAAPAGASGAIGGIQGDVNCDEVVNAIDSLQILRAVAGLSVTAECLTEAGDANCSSVADSVDALRILRYVASLPTNTQAGCEEIGQALPGGARGEARQLAIEVLGADADEARYDALLKVMEMLRIGVYTSEGGEVQQGAERGPGDFYLYDFELRMMAASLGRGDNSWVVQQIADTLDQVGYREDGQPFTAEDLNQIIHDATVDSLAAPEEESSFVPILVRELGVRHEMSYDLAEDLDVNDAQFDALQLTLILVSLTLPVIAEEGPLDAPASTLAAEFNGILTSQPVGLADCDDFRGVGNWGVRVLTTKFFETASKKVVAIAKKVAAFIDIYHGEQLALSVRVKALDSSVGPTHYDHGSGSPGQNLEFRIEVRMLDDLGETLVECGWLAALNFPAQGGIPGVTVSFQTDIQNELKDHGTLDCTGLLCDRTTDLNGIATLTFDPKSETEPYGQGIETEATGVVSGIAWYQSKFENLFGTLAQLLVPKYGSTRWFVRYHGCPSGAGSAQAAQAASGVPCAYEGHASATHTLPFAGFTITTTMTATGLRFEPIPDPAHPDGVTYQLVEGVISVQATGGGGGCVVSGGYVITQPMDDGVHTFGGYIALDVENNKYAATGGVGDMEQHVFLYCPEQVPLWIGTIGNLWLLTASGTPPIPDRPFTPEDPLQGVFGESIAGWVSTYEWYFEPIICSTGPAPVCDVPAAADSASQKLYRAARTLPD